jgi:hypothetical protein
MRNCKLPAGVKSLDEILDYPLADQIVFLVTLLEYLLRQLHRDCFDTRLTDLIAMHADKFSTPGYEIHKARWVRNQIIHATGKASYEETLLAVNALQQTISELSGLQDFQRTTLPQPRPAFAAMAAMA